MGFGFFFSSQWVLLVIPTLAHPPLLWQLNFPPHCPHWDVSPLSLRCSQCPILRHHWAPTGAFPHGFHAVPLSLCGNYSGLAQHSGCRRHNAEECLEEAEFSNKIFVSQSESNDCLHLQTHNKLVFMARGSQEIKFRCLL